MNFPRFDCSVFMMSMGQAGWEGGIVSLDGEVVFGAWWD